MLSKGDFFKEKHGYLTKPYRANTDGLFKRPYKSPKECWEFEREEFEELPEMFRAEEKTYEKPIRPMPFFPEHDNFGFPAGSVYRKRLEEVRHQRIMNYCRYEEKRKEQQLRQKLEARLRTIRTP